jgi:hypothetical protein
VTVIALHTRPPAWELLQHAISEHKTVRAIYHGHERLLCPHLLGWRHGRAKLLAYQASGTTSTGPPNADPRQRWRSMFVDEIEQVVIATDRWQTAPNYTPTVAGIDLIEVATPIHNP